MRDVAARSATSRKSRRARREGPTSRGDRALREGAKLNPDEEEIREKLLDVYLAAATSTRARIRHQRRAVQDGGGGAGAQGKATRRSTRFRQAANQHDYDNELRAHVARAFLARAISPPARYLTVETAATIPAVDEVADMRLGGTA